MVRVSRQCAHQHGQRAAHQEGGQAHQHQWQQPGGQADPLFEPGEWRGGHAQPQGGADAEHGHTDFKARIQQQGLAQAVGVTAKQQPAKGQPGKEGADAGGDGVHLDTYHQRQLFDPQHLIDQGGSTGDKQQQGGGRQCSTAGR